MTVKVSVDTPTSSTTLFSSNAGAWILLALATLLVHLLLPVFPWLSQFPAEWAIPLADWINAAMDTIVEIVKPVTRAISAILEWPMIVLRDVLQWLPWPVTVAAVVLLAAHASGIKLAILSLLAMLYIALSGYWNPSMSTMALVGIAVPLSLILGLAIGIAADRTELGKRIVPPILDIMQTMPTFAYLIPILVLFGFGPVVGLIASAIYACPPMVRNVHLGLKRVPSEIVEAATMSGVSRFQKLFWVELPAAMAQIKLGINQTIMATLSMVIIASVIGGFGDIGWEVLSTIRKARFGDSLLAGFVIVLIAVVMDRISSAYVTQDDGNDVNTRVNKKVWFTALIVILLVCLVTKLMDIDFTVEHSAWAKALSGWLDTQLDGFVVAYGNALTEIKNSFFFYYLLPLRIGFNKAILPLTWGFDFTEIMRWGYACVVLVISLVMMKTRSWQAGIGVAAISYLLYFGLTGAPWIVLGLALTLLAWQVGGIRVGLFTACSLIFILITGMWGRAMLSVYLCGAAVILSFVIGSSIGVWAAASDRVSKVIQPIVDTLQTIPAFVYLIPVLMFFQVGEFTALLAIIAYAVVPAIRYTENGLRQVSPQLIEVAVEQGCTPMQIFWQVKVPLAIPTIMVGLNQTIMFGFAMLVIAALVGTTGLGQQIFLALSAADTGLGLIAGLSMALLAMITDRIMQAWAAKKFEGLESAD